MTGETRRILAVSARSGRLGYVLLEDQELLLWGTSEQAARSAERAAQKLSDWVEEFVPDVLVTESPGAGCYKQRRQLAILRAFVRVGKSLAIEHRAVRRRHARTNLYLDAKAVAERIPELARLVPKKPPIWVTEPYRLVCFEAVVLVEDSGLLVAEEGGQAAS